jgi:hypothetical protein
MVHTRDCPGFGKTTKDAAGSHGEMYRTKEIGKKGQKGIVDVKFNWFLDPSIIFDPLIYIAGLVLSQ